MSDDPHYLAVLNVPDERDIEVGALGTFSFPEGDYIYVGRAKSGFDARLDRHRRTSDKSIRWHIDYLRDEARWVEARVPDAESECLLADRIASRPGAERHVEGFGASDCSCAGHLIRHPAPPEDLPCSLWRGEGLEAEYVDRPNRFVLRAELPTGEMVRAHLPNTARLTELLVPGRRILLEPNDDPERSTDYTARRFWDDTWVSVEAHFAESMVEDQLARSYNVPTLGAIRSWRTQVERAGHRFDVRLERTDGSPLWLEVKSLSRNFDGDAVLSGTPSSRGVAHLGALSELAASGEDAAVAFIVQRNDARRLIVGQPGVDARIDPDWVEAVRSARDAGVSIVGLGCRITPTNGWVARELPVVDADTGDPLSD